MRLALDEARLAAQIGEGPGGAGVGDEARLAAQIDEVPVGAVVVDADGVVVGQGHNRRKSANDPTAHAEVLAIRAAAGKLASWRLDACTLVVTLEPCTMCAGAVVLSRI